MNITEAVELALTGNTTLFEGKDGCGNMIELKIDACTASNEKSVAISVNVFGSRNKNERAEIEIDRDRLCDVAHTSGMITAALKNAGVNTESIMFDGAPLNTTMDRNTIRCELS